VPLHAFFVCLRSCGGLLPPLPLYYSAAAALIPQLHIERWAFDVEILFLAARKGVPVAVRKGGGVVKQ
jgi:hypothetical protein